MLITVLYHPVRFEFLLQRNKRKNIILVESGFRSEPYDLGMGSLGISSIENKPFDQAMTWAKV